MSSILNTYNRKKITFTKGKGSFLYDTKGKKYLDFVQGIAVNCLGHSNSHLIKSIYKQSKKLWHISNVFNISNIVNSWIVCFEQRLTIFKLFEILRIFRMFRIHHVPRVGVGGLNCAARGWRVSNVLNIKKCFIYV